MTRADRRGPGAVSTTIVEEARAALSSPEAPEPGATVVVAASGGLDSTVLLHLLRFPLAGRLVPVAAHFDHGWRHGSVADADWVRGLCRAWDVPIRIERARDVPWSEAAARRARYAFLERVASETGASAILTAHHADDQAETVLFRVLRGTGLRGLGGIRRSRDGLILRPLLGVWREALEAYATTARLGWREDPTNRDPAYARNAVRHTLIPEAERLAPGARRALVRLSRIAATEEKAWDELVEALLPGVDLVETGDGTSFDRQAWAAWPTAVRARLLRSLVRRLGLTLDERTTDRALRFAAEGRSGAAIELGSGVELRRSFDRLVVRYATAAEADRELRIAGPGPGSGAVRIGGRRLQVWWGSGDRDAPATVRPQGGAERARLAVIHYPLVVRARSAGDRIRLERGTRTVKKLLVEARVPAHRRSAQPIVADGRGTVLWVPGIARSVEAAHTGGDGSLSIGIG